MRADGEDPAPRCALPITSLGSAHHAVPPSLPLALPCPPRVFPIERELGRGGMATVYLAHDLRHDRPVALKLLHPDLAYALGAERFLREIRTAARLQHPHILSV